MHQQKLSVVLVARRRIVETRDVLSR